MQPRTPTSRLYKFLKAKRGADPDVDPDVAAVGPGRNHEDPDVAGVGLRRNRVDPDTARRPGVMLSCGRCLEPKSRGQKTAKSKLRILGPPPLGDAVVDQALTEKLDGCYFFLPACATDL